jgi:hypothetical protein
MVGDLFQNDAAGECGAHVLMIYAAVLAQLEFLDLVTPGLDLLYTKSQ